jgi:formate dehydrogenase subunit beta
MITHRLLQTHGQPLTTIQKFLTRLFERADVLGMIAPIRPPGTAQVEARFVQTAPALRHVDPFAPVMRCNAAKLAAELAQEHPTDRLGAVLRPCEVRALVELDRREGLDFSRFLIVGVDCVGTFPVEDYAARASFAGGADALTNEVLQFARSGGLGVNRYRVACQMCDTHMPEGVDLILNVFGLATHEMLLVTVRKDALIDQLGLAEITDGPADPARVWEHVQAHNVVTARRVRNRERFMQALPQTLPRNLTDLAVHLATRATCHECFKACPLVDSSLDLTGSDDAAVQLSRWLDSCVECGMCEQACPRHLLLTVEHEHIRQCLLPAVEPAG